MFKSIGLYIAGAAVMALFIYVMTGLYGALFNVQEDDATFNCHTMGNMVCGPDAPWHGFVNNFQHADYR